MLVGEELNFGSGGNAVRILTTKHTPSHERMLSGVERYPTVIVVEYQSELPQTLCDTAKLILAYVGNSDQVLRCATSHGPTVAN